MGGGVATAEAHRDLGLGADDLRELEQLVSGDEVEYALTIPGEGGETEVFFSDLGPDYARFNAEYTS